MKKKFQIFLMTKFVDKNSNHIEFINFSFKITCTAYNMRSSLSTKDIECAH